MKAAASALLGVALAATPAAAGDLLCDFGPIKVTTGKCSFPESD